MRNDDKSGKEIEDEISVREETYWTWGKKGGGGLHRNILTKDEQVSYRYDTPASTFTSVILRHSSFV
jgi:hypothetical protein